MALGPEFRKKLQIFLAAALVIAGGRAAYIVVRAARGYEGRG